MLAIVVPTLVTQCFSWDTENRLTFLALQVVLARRIHEFVPFWTRQEPELSRDLVPIPLTDKRTGEWCGAKAAPFCPIRTHTASRAVFALDLYNNKEHLIITLVRIKKVVSFFYFKKKEKKKRVAGCNKTCADTQLRH